MNLLRVSFSSYLFTLREYIKWKSDFQGTKIIIKKILYCSIVKFLQRIDNSISALLT